jgi:ubiquitin carboxyl-terminal hydrolase 4/11/15
MNSVLQCLSNTPIFNDYFNYEVYNTEINTKNKLGTKGELAKHFASLVQQIWAGKFLHVVPSDFKRVLVCPRNKFTIGYFVFQGNFAPQFSGYQQHDSQELLAFLLVCCHYATSSDVMVWLTGWSA